MIFCVPHNGALDLGELHADLMATTRFQSEFEKRTLWRMTWRMLKEPVVGDGLSRLFTGRGATYKKGVGFIEVTS